MVHPFAITFALDKTSDAQTPYTIVQNEQGFLVGQIVSDVIIVKRQFPSYVDPPYPTTKIDICLFEALDQNSSLIDPRYTVFDLGRNISSTHFRPEYRNMSDFFNSSVAKHAAQCFEQVDLVEDVTAFSLILRLNSSENYQLLSSSEKSILIASGALYGTASVIIFFITLLVASRRANLFLFLVNLQSFLLTLCRCVYFFLIVFYLIPIGSLLDFILVDIPTFLYFQILIQILISFYTSSKFYETQKRIRPLTVWLITLSFWLAVWLLFAAIAIAVSTVDTSSLITYSCQCRLSSVQQPADTARYLRIGYKSALIVLSVIVFVAMFLLVQNEARQRTKLIFNFILVISFCLSLNCLAFVIYYAVNNPTPYFAFVLWFTELVPILFLCVLLAFPDLKYFKSYVTTSRMT